MKEYNYTIGRLRMIWKVITKKGCLLMFEEEPKEGDTLTVGSMKATFSSKEYKT